MRGIAVARFESKRVLIVLNRILPVCDFVLLLFLLHSPARQHIGQSERRLGLQVPVSISQGATQSLRSLVEFARLVGADTEIVIELRRPALRPLILKGFRRAGIIRLRKKSLRFLFLGSSRWKRSAEKQ